MRDGAPGFTRTDAVVVNGAREACDAMIDMPVARDKFLGIMANQTERMGRLIEEIRNGTLQLRMVPIGETFSRFRRVVRDTATELGKDVVLELNTLGDRESRTAYRAALIDYFSTHKEELSEDSRLRLERNGLQVAMRSGQVFDVALSATTATIRDYGEAVVRVEGSGEGSGYAVKVVSLSCRSIAHRPPASAYRPPAPVFRDGSSDRRHCSPAP